MAIGDDITAYPTINGTVFRYTGVNNNQYTWQAFFSFVMEMFNEPGYGVYKVPMKYNTGTYYTMQNGGFLDNGDGSYILEHLYEGSCDTSGYTNNILMITGDGLTNFVPGDKDLIIANTTQVDDVGRLLAYKNDYPVSGEAVIWVRDTEGGVAIINNDALDATGGSGDFVADAGEYTGEEIYSGVFSLAAANLFEGPGNPDGQIYLFQDMSAFKASFGDGPERIVFASGDDIHGRGEFDITIPTKIGGTLIDSGSVQLFMRQSGDAFAYVNATLDASYKPVAVATVQDNNYATPENYILIDNVASGTPAAGNVVYESVGTEFYFEIVSATNITGAEWLLGIRGLHVKPTHAVTDNDTVTNGTWTADVNGTEGDAWFDYTPGTDFTTNGQILTQAVSGAKALQRGYSAAGDTVVCEVDYTLFDTTADPYYIDMTLTNGVTGATTGSATPDTYARGVAGFSDVTVVHINGTVAAGTFGGTFEMGEQVTWDTGSSSGNIVYTDGATTITLGNVTSPDTITGDTITGTHSGATCVASGNLVDDRTEGFYFPKKSTYQYTVYVQGGSLYTAGRTVNQIYQYLKYLCRDGSTWTFYTSTGAAIVEEEGQEYLTADQGGGSSYAISKTAPLATYAGTAIYGAQGVWITGMTAADANNVVLIDDTGTTREPDTAITLYAVGTESGDWVEIFPRSGTAIEYDQFTSHATLNLQSDNTIVIQEAIPNDIPEDSYVYVYDVDNLEIHPYRCASWVTSTFTLATSLTGTAEGGSSGNVLFDTGVFASGIQRGDIIRNTATDKWGIVLSVDSANQITTDEESGTPGDPVVWNVGNAFEHNVLINTYDGSDTVFCAYMAREASLTTEEVGLLYVGAKDTIVFCRDSGGTPIIPFVLDSGTFGAQGASYNIIRNTDIVKT